MEDIKPQINDFLKKCSELKNCKFIMAPTKIKDLLKSIVNSRALYELFTSVSAEFDYPLAKSRCLINLTDGFEERGVVVLPQSTRDKLAFIFCLLVEIDRDSINFNWFLQKYFSDDDGSFYGSYFSFCENIITPFERIIGGMFASYLKEQSDTARELAPAAQPQAGAQGLSQMLSTISLMIAQEKQYILESSIPFEEKQSGYRMLTEIFNALKERRFDVAEALVGGYNYYILYHKSFSANVRTLFESIEKYRQSA